MRLFAEPVDATLDDAAFNEHALHVFGWQYGQNAPYRAYCERRHRTPATITHWSEVPPVPTAAFREVALATGAAEDAQAVFRTSGTTHGSERRGTHYILDLAVYEASLLPNFNARLFPDHANIPVLSLIPRAAEMPDSSLAHMVDVVMKKIAAHGSGYYATVADGIDSTRLERALLSYAEDGTPVCILGTSFSFVHWLDDLQARGARIALPPGSRLMDTGGYKGRSREVPAHSMLELYETLLSVPPHACVNEYGMTELCSQMYDVTFTEYMTRGAAGTRRKRPPPWMRVTIVDPITLLPVPHGQTGLVQIFDLANLNSVAAVQTEDLAVAVEDGYSLLGRAPGAQPRGCSIAMDDLLQAVRTR